MKFTKTALSAAFLSAGLAFSGFSEAALEKRIDGMWYDTVLNVTWLDMTATDKTWDEAVDWASNLNHAGFEGWRLPTVKPVNGTDFQYGVEFEGINYQTADGSTDWGWNITSPNSELSHLFYVTLGNVAEFDQDGFLTDNSGLSNTGPFKNLQAGVYWTGTEFFLDTEDFAWIFQTDLGLQTDDLKTWQNLAIAVRDGDFAPVPVPAAVWFMITGLMGLVGMRKKAAA